MGRMRMWIYYREGKEVLFAQSLPEPGLPGLLHPGDPQRPSQPPEQSS